MTGRLQDKHKLVVEQMLERESLTGGAVRADGQVGIAGDRLLDQRGAEVFAQPDCDAGVSPSQLAERPSDHAKRQ